MKRRAIVRGTPGFGAKTLTQAIEPYLPNGWKVIALRSDGVVIEGEDRSGWTLDDYILPRLASGLYFGEEI